MLSPFTFLSNPADPMFKFSRINPPQEGSALWDSGRSHGAAPEQLCTRVGGTPGWKTQGLSLTLRPWSPHHTLGLTNITTASLFPAAGSCLLPPAGKEGSGCCVSQRLGRGLSSVPLCCGSDSVLPRPAVLAEGKEGRKRSWRSGGPTGICLFNVTLARSRPRKPSQSCPWGTQPPES